MDLYADVAAQYTEFAEYAAASASPCFEQWAYAVAADEEVLAWISALPGIKKQPNLVFAAARFHGVTAPGPYEALRSALLDDDGTIRATILERSTQTNEAGRLATLTPVFARLAIEAGRRPLALVEAGASAGLCLYPDRWGYDWTAPGTRTARTTRAAVLGPEPRLACPVTGDLALPTALPEITWRGGLDLNPLDVRDKDQMAWLEILVWPEHDDRRDRLRHAIEIARAEPPHLEQGDILADLPLMVADASRHGEVVVFHSAVVAYLPAEDRARFDTMMRRLVADGACRWVSNEGLNVVPSVLDGAPEPPDTKTLALAVDGRAVAWSHPHGRSMRWFG
ncbi:DUF2332 domain-containing protein [Myceligenerans salitolerans]|uniref:DUF2332 domain-containing protein n=1 Tax=Myceligenerans salitolerans TaxID=1230528 RepID=A0ABS3IC40_9MICO|nr:DUF2332 domain-containing protein [Myceligenerans salitolerans]MBO0610563.1 DUF2332 domain-containing protein [Myceligenerans salitolerans]